MSSKRNKVKRVVLIVLCSLLALILAGLLTVVILGNSLLNKINRFGDDPTLSSEQLESFLNQTESMDPNFTGDVLDPDDIYGPEGPVDSIDKKDNIITFLLVGQDRRPGEPRLHSDSMILCTINKSTKTMTLTSFMRDIWLTLPDGDEPFEQRLNFAYLWGGFDLLNATLEHNFGVSSENNIEVDFSGFKKIIETVGGVDIELTAAEANYLNVNGNWDSGEVYDGSWTLKKGVNHLTASQALAYSRIRDIGGDYARTNRQRTVITALVAQAKNMNVAEIYNLVESILPMITTNMTNAEILKLVGELAPILPELKVVSQRIPVEGAYSEAWVRGNAVLVLSEEDRKTNIKVLEEIMSQG